MHMGMEMEMKMVKYGAIEICKRVMDRPRDGGSCEWVK